jgi:hypothetical protein
MTVKRLLIVYGCCALAPILYSCGGASGSTASPNAAGATAITVSGTPATHGTFDASPKSDQSGGLWMSYSAVTQSTNDPVLGEVRTRIAVSRDAGATWTDLGIDPNAMSNADLLVPNPGGTGSVWAVWRFEVSSLLYDAYDADATRRWKLLWHRYVTLDLGGKAIQAFSDGWIGLTTAPSPDGPWSAERKLFTGSSYDNTINAFIGAPEFPLASTYSAPGQLGACAVFTEPGMLARADGIYISLQCAGSQNKIVGLRCDRGFASCAYVGDFLAGSEAAQFSQSGQSLSGFAASELVASAGNTYLIVTPYEQSEALYRGCLAFQVGDLSTATILRSGGKPVPVARIYGTSGSFNGACGYDPAANGSGIIFGEYNSTMPNFRLYASHITLP